MRRRGVQLPRVKRSVDDEEYGECEDAIQTYSLSCLERGGGSYRRRMVSPLMQASLVSILVPLYDEEEFIGPLLDNVLAAPLPQGLDREIIVVDDGSRDGSAEVVEQMAARMPDLIRLVR